MRLRDRLLRAAVAFLTAPEEEREERDWEGLEAENDALAEAVRNLEEAGEEMAKEAAALPLVEQELAQARESLKREVERAGVWRDQADGARAEALTLKRRVAQLEAALVKEAP